MVTPIADLPYHPHRSLERYLIEAPARYLVPGEAGPTPSAEGEGTIEALLRGRREGLEAMASVVERLIGERREAMRSVLNALDRDHLYLENLILDRYRPMARPTDDPTYVNLRVQQLRIERERREEERAFWRDTVLLAKEHGELLRRVHEARQRERLLEGEGYR